MTSIFQVLTLAWSLQGGMFPGTITSDSITAVYHDSPTFYAQYGFELSYPVFSGEKSDISGLYAGTELRNEFVKGQYSFQMAPIQDTYTFYGGLRWQEFTVGFEHKCTHSVENLVQSSIVSQRLFGSSDDIFIRLAGKI